MTAYRFWYALRFYYTAFYINCQYFIKHSVRGTETEEFRKTILWQFMTTFSKKSIDFFKIIEYNIKEESIPIDGRSRIK